jgi:adenylylsulfate kinase
MSDRQPTIAVDFDGVIAEYDGWRGPDLLGDPRADVVQALQILRGEGWKVIVHTTRSETEIRAYLEQHHIPYDEVNRNSSYQNSGPKPVATVYWDDRAVCYSGNGLKDLDRIRNFRTWAGRQ